MARTVVAEAGAVPAKNLRHRSSEKVERPQIGFKHRCVTALAEEHKHEQISRAPSKEARRLPLDWLQVRYESDSTARSLENGRCMHRQPHTHGLHRLHHRLRIGIFRRLSDSGFLMRVVFRTENNLVDVHRKRTGRLVRGYAVRASLHTLPDPIL